MRGSHAWDTSARALLVFGLGLGVLAGTEAAPASASEPVPLLGRQGEAPVFSLLGFIQQGAVRRAILALDGLVVVAGPGELVLETYRVVRLEEEAAVLRGADRETRVTFQSKTAQAAPPPQPPPPGMGTGRSRMPNMPGQSGESPVPTQGGVPAGLGGGMTPSGPFSPPSAASPAQPGSGGSGPGTQSSSAATPPGAENPFAESLRRQGAQTPTTSTNNPFMRANQQQQTLGR
jgi:hypothetical protein